MSNRASTVVTREGENKALGALAVKIELAKRLGGWGWGQSWVVATLR